ncbi:MAG: globin domain-containing protein [Phycisphaerales bacterium]
MPVRRHPIIDPRTGGPLLKIPADEALIGRLRRSFAIVQGEGVRLGELFYQRLFEAAPQVRSMFRSDISAQSAKLIAALEAVVSNLERPEENAAMIAELGRRHAGYGARPEHYVLVTELLVASMEELLGPRIDAQTLDEWRLVLRLVSEQMIAASRDPGESTLPTGERG